MTNKKASVSKVEWGQSKKEFQQHLAKILELQNKGLTRTDIHAELNLQMSYKQFCHHYSLLQSSPDHSIFPRRPSVGSKKVPVIDPSSTGSAPQRVGPTGNFSMPEVNVDETKEGDVS